MKNLKRLLAIMISLSLICSMVIIAAPQKALAANPYLPLWEHIPDAEVHLFHDPDDITKERVYIYGSHDLIRASTYCAYDIVSWSTPPEDMTDWRYEGPVYTFIRNNNNLPSTLFAPDCAEVKRKVTLKAGINRDSYADNQKLATSDYEDRKYDEYPVYYDKKNDCGYIFDYYLYPHPNGITWVICHSKGSPTGPFEIVNADANSNKLAILEDGSTAVNNGFDPGVVVDTDEDGYAVAAYLWWAGFDTIVACKLNMDNMASAEFDQALADQDTTGKYNCDPTSNDYGVKRNFLPVAGVSNYSNVHAWPLEDNINPDDPTKNKYDIIDKEDLDLIRIFEASSPRKIGNKWVFVYSGYAGPEYGTYSSNAILKYCYSDNPLGPWKYGGVIVDARGPQLDQNGNMMTTNSYGNTHGGLVEANDQWYIFYHRCINQNEHSRQHMADPVYVKADEKPVADGGSVVITGYDTDTKGSKILKDVNGNIYTGAEVTSSGMQLDGLNPYQYFSAGLATWVTPERTTGNVPVVPAPDFITYIQATYDIHEDAAPILNIRDGSIMGYKYFNFDVPKPAGKSTTLDLYITPKGVDFTIDIMMDTPWPEGTPNAGKKLGELTVSADARQVKTKYTISVPELDNVKGKHAIYFVCRSGNTVQENCQFSGFAFGHEEVLLSDSFASLNNWTAPANVTVSGGALTMANNGALTSKKGSGWQDYEFTTDIESITDSLSIQFMKKDSKNYYELTAADDGTLALSSVSENISKELVSTDKGVFTAPAAISISVADGVIKVYVDGVSMLRTENGDHDFGAVGFATAQAAAARINRVLVRAATDKEVATSDMKIKVDGKVVPLPNSVATTTANAYTDSGNYDFTYAHSNADAPVVTATCSDKNVKISIQQPDSATGMAIVRANKGGYTKNYRIMLARGKTVTGTINPVKNGMAYPGGAPQDMIDDIMAGEDLSGNWRLDVSVMVDNALKGDNGFAAGTRAGVGIYDSDSNYYQVSAQRHSTATNVTAANAGVGYVVNGDNPGSENSKAAFAVDHMVNTMTYYQMFTYNLRITKNGTALQGALNNSSTTYTNIGNAQTFDASVFDKARVQLFATNTAADRNLSVKYVATLITEDYVNPNVLPAVSGTIKPEKNGKAYGDPAKNAGDIKTIDLSSIPPEVLAGDWAATVTFTAKPTLQASNEDIQVGIGMSAGSEPEKNFFQTHMRRNGTKENNVGAAIYVKEDSAPTELGPVLTGNPPTNPPTSTLNTHVVRLTKIGNTLRGAYATTRATTWANLGGTLATKYPKEFFENAVLNVFATNGSAEEFETDYTVTFAPIKTPMPISYDQLAVEDAASLIGNGIAVKDTDDGANDMARAQGLLDADAGLTALGVTCTVRNASPYELTITKGRSSMTITPFAILNVTNKDWGAFDALVNKTIGSLDASDYTAVSWNRLQKVLQTVKDITESGSSTLEIGLAYERVETAYKALEVLTPDTSAVIAVDGINDGGYTKNDTVSVTVAQSGGSALTSVTLSINGEAAHPAGFVSSGTPFDIETSSEGEYYIEAATADGKKSGFVFYVDKTIPSIKYDPDAKTVTINDQNPAFVTINGQALAINDKTYIAALATDQYEVSAEDKAGNTAVLSGAPVDKTDLVQTINAALDKMFGDNLANYTTGSANEYKNALAAAQTLNANPDARQIDIDKAVLRLNEAMSGLVSRVELKEVIAKAESLNLDDYMQFQVRYQKGSAGSTTTNFLIELENCKMMYGRPSYTQDNLDWAIGRMRDIMGSLVSRVPLREALARANEILDNSADVYTAASISAVQTAVEKATAFYNQKTNATAADVAAQTDSVNVSIGNLVSEASVNALDEAIAKAILKLETDYTEASWSPFKKALDAAIALQGSDTLTQDAVDEATLTLNNAMADLAAAAPAVSKEVLEEVVSSAERIGNEDGKYTADTFAELTDAIRNAHAVLLDENATQTQVDDAARDIVDKIAALGLVDPTPAAVKTVLEDTIASAGKIDAAMYTAASYKKLKDAMAAGQAILDKENVTQAEIDTASKNIIDAISALVLETPVIKYADLKALQTAIMKAKTFTSSAYTPQSFAALQRALSVAENLNIQKPEEGLQSTVNVAAASLENAIKALVEAAPRAGTKYNVGNLKYKVTASSDGQKTVTVTGMVNRKKTSITIPATITIKGYKFKVNAISENAFRKNKRIKKVTIGANLAVIGKQAFNGCSKLKMIKINSKVLSSVKSNAFKGIASKANIKVPSAKRKVYKTLLKGKGQGRKVKITK